MQKLIIILFILIYNLNFGQDKIYKLISKTENSDINYNAFNDDFNGFKEGFNPKKGKNDVYVFTSEFKGDSFDGTSKTFHDYLILKVNPKSDIIIDGFQYTMEWAELPAISDLYRVTEKNIKISDGLKLDLLKMELHKDFQTEYRKYLADNGELHLN